MNVYVGTISDWYYNSFGIIPTQNKFKFFKKYADGYVFTSNSKTPPRRTDVVQIMNTRAGQGLLGTYHDGKVPRNNTKESQKIYNLYDDVYECWMYNQNNCKIKLPKRLSMGQNQNNALRPFLYKEEIDTETYEKMLDQDTLLPDIEDYHNIPIIFYLFEFHDLKQDIQINFKWSRTIAGIYNIYKTYVDRNHIGFMVITDIMTQNPSFVRMYKGLFSMWGDQAGIAIFKNFNGVYAMGNCDPNQLDLDRVYAEDGGDGYVVRMPS